MTDLQDYEAKLRAEIAVAEQRAEHAYRDLVGLDLHPMSGEYKMYQQLALTLGGHARRAARRPRATDWRGRVGPRTGREDESVAEASEALTCTF